VVSRGGEGAEGGEGRSFKTLIIFTTKRDKDRLSQSKERIWNLPETPDQNFSWGRDLPTAKAAKARLKYICYLIK